MIFDIVRHLYRQREFSMKTFGPGKRRKGVADHIRKELAEIEADPDGKGECEWIDVIILGFDGALRDGRSPEEIVELIERKQSKNEGRNWPDWRLFGEDQAIEHDRSGDAATEVMGDHIDLDHVTQGNLITSFGGHNVKLPLGCSNEDTGVVLDADGVDVLTVDSNGARPDAQTAAIAILVVSAINHLAGMEGDRHG